MSRIVTFLAGVSVVAAGASASAACDASGCSTCVGTGAASVCVNYTAPPPAPICLGCNNACPMTVCTSGCATACNVCLPGPLNAGVCIQATVGTGVILASRSSLDAALDFSLFANVQSVSVDASASGTISGNSIVALTGGATAIATLNVGSGFTSSAIFEVNTSTTVNTWNNNAGTAKVDNNCTDLVVGNLSVGGSSFSVFQSCPTATVTIQNIDFSTRSFFSGAATVQIAGGVAHVGVNANGAASGSIQGNGKMKLSGAVSIDGNIPSGVTVDVSTAGSSGPLIAVDSGKRLNVSGDMTGTSGTVAVNGNLVFGEATVNVEPRVIVNAGASLVFNSATTLSAKAVSVSSQATLVVGANVKSSAMYVEKFEKCLGTVQINLATTASAFISSSAAGAGVAFTYSANNNPQQLASCAVQVVDSAGTTFTLTSQTSASAGRRLLSSSGTATWGPNSMSYNMGQQASAAPSINSLIPLAVAGTLALLA